MEQQIERTITYEHELDVDGQWFTEKKKCEELQDGMVHTMHSQQIGDDKIIVKQTLDKDGNLIDEDGKPTDEQTIETNMDGAEDIASFKTEWESGWNPKFGKETDPTGSTGFFSKFKNALKFW